MSSIAAVNPTIAPRVAELENAQIQTRRARVDRMFAVLLVVQYIAGIIGAWLVSPYAWAGKERVVHMHVWVAVIGGAGIALLPILMAIFRPGTKLTRHVIAASQMLS
ncbi:MAG TPA: histidine kinase, partial [Thermoanaerobaculia bacterium]|nr:histidine kinase [Thermoanaerobaculia bacterium]